MSSLYRSSISGCLLSEVRQPCGHAHTYHTRSLLHCRYRAQLLTDMIDDGQLPEYTYDIGFEHYDKEWCEHWTVSDWSETKAPELNGRIKASVEWYRSVDHVYTFMLRDAICTGSAFTGNARPLWGIKVGRMKLVAVDSKNVALATATAVENLAAVIASDAAEVDDERDDFTSGLVNPRHPIRRGAGTSGAPLPNERARASALDRQGEEPRQDDEEAYERPAAQRRRLPQYDGPGDGQDGGGGGSGGGSRGGGNGVRSGDGSGGGGGEDALDDDDDFDDDDVVVATNATLAEDDEDDEECLAPEADADDGILGPDPNEVEDGEEVDEEEPLNSDDDEDDEDDEGAGDGTVALGADGPLNADAVNLVLAQFDKVRRAGELWKLTLRAGTAHLVIEGKNNHYAFASAVCEFTFG